MTNLQIFERISGLAAEITPHSKFTAAILYCAAGAVIQGKDEELSQLTAVFCDFQTKQIDKLRSEILNRN